MQPYGAPPPGYGWQQPAPMVPMQAQQPPPNRGGGAGAIIAIVAALFILVAGGAVAGGIYWFILRKPAPHLAQWAPKNASLYVELPSFPRTVLAAALMKPLDHSRVDDRRMRQDLVLAFSNAFGVSEADAQAVVTSLSAGAFVARDTNHNIGNAAILVTFSNASIEKILASSRFAEAGPFLSGGTRYTLERRPPALVAPNATLAEHALSDMTTTGYGTPLDLVWFPSKRLLAFGDDTLVTDVAACVGGKADSLEKSVVYRTAKETFEKGSDVAFFYDPHDLDDVRDPDDEKLLDGWLHDRRPLTGAVKLVRAGVVLDAHATLDGSDVPSAGLLPPPPKLEFPHELPRDTIAYVAFSTRTKLKGPAIRALMTKSLTPGDAKKLDDALAQTSATLGFSFDDVVDVVGDETAMGVLLDPAFKLDTSNGMNDEIANVGLVWTLAVKDPAKARDVLGKLRAQLEAKDLAGKVKVTTAGADEWQAQAAQASSTLPLPTLTVKFDGKKIVAVVASPTMTARALAALETGKGSLRDDPAHEMALGAMPKDARLYVWTDTGRITSVMSDAESHVAKHEARAMLPLDAVRLTGPDRVTSAIALRATHEASGWSVDLDSLNLPALGFFSLAGDLDIDSAMRKTESQ